MEMITRSLSAVFLKAGMLLASRTYLGVHHFDRKYVSQWIIPLQTPAAEPARAQTHRNRTWGLPPAQAVVLRCCSCLPPPPKDFFLRANPSLAGTHALPMLSLCSPYVQATKPISSLITDVFFTVSMSVNRPPSFSTEVKIHSPVTVFPSLPLQSLSGRYFQNYHGSLAAVLFSYVSREFQRGPSNECSV